MGEFAEEIDFEIAIENERPRLVRLCAWFTGVQETAEDLAQETLIAAWINRGQLRSMEKLSPWISAIARNTCLKWLKEQQREQAYTADPIHLQETAEDQPQDENDLEWELDRQELIQLLDQALAYLPGNTADLLVEHYVKESSHAEIAAKMGMNVGSVAVRLQRGKLTLQKILRTRLQEEAQAFGLISEDTDQWEATNIWCPTCGQSRLYGQYQKQESSGRFALRCPKCDPDPEMISAAFDLSVPYYANLLGDMKTYKPAYARLATSVAAYYRQVLASHTANCIVCGKQAQMIIDHHKKLSPGKEEASDILVNCPACGWASNITTWGLILALPDVQRFWKDQPRMIALPVKQIEVQGSPAVLTEIHSLSSAAKLEVVSIRDTFEPIRIHSNVQ